MTISLFKPFCLFFIRANNDNRIMAGDGPYNLIKIDIIDNGRQQITITWQRLDDIQELNPSDRQADFPNRAPQPFKL